MNSLPVALSFTIHSAAGFEYHHVEGRDRDVAAKLPPGEAVCSGKVSRDDALLETQVDQKDIPPLGILP